MSKPLVIILNGPPGSGKDTIGEAWINTRDFSITKHLNAFKVPMFRIAAEVLDMSYHDFLGNYNENREWKEKKRPEWGDRSVRDLMIHISEVFVKPFFGSDYFGKISADVVRQYQGFQGNRHVIVFTDGGFPFEIEELEKEFPVQVIQLHREGCDFTGDSRSYVECKRGSIILENNETIHEAVEKLQKIIESVRGSLDLK